MSEALVMVWLAIIGLTTLSPTWGRLPTPALVSLVIPMGAATYILSALAMLASGVSFSTYSALWLASLAAVALTATVHRYRSRAGGSIPYSAARVPFGYAVIGTLIVATIAQNVHLTRLTVDSVRSLLTAQGLETTGSLELINRGDLRARHLVVPLLHTSGVISGRGYVASITPLFALSGLGFAAWLALRAFASFGTPQRWRHWLLLGGGALVLTTNRILYHAFYVNGHMVFAVYLLIGVGAAWIARRGSMGTMFLPASLAFAALPALRPEAVVTGLIFLIAVVATVDVSGRLRWALSTPFIVATVLWYGVLLAPRSFDADLGLFGSVYGNIVLVAGFAVVLAASHHRLGRWLLPAAPWLTLAGIVGYVGVNALRNSDLLRTSLAATGVNIAIEGLWGVFWWIVPLFVLGAVLVTTLPLERMWILPGVTYGVALLAFIYLRNGPYRVGQGDSGNGMFMHVAFVLVVYVVIAAGHAVAPTGTPETQHTEPASAASF